MSLEKLFNPSSIAVVGASNTPGKVGNVIFSNLRRGKVRVYPVNPYEDYVGGEVSYPSVTDLPETVDLAVIAIPAHHTVEVAAECAARRIPFIIPVASGFAEVGEEGEKLQKALIDSIRGSRTRILGPNTLGILVPRNGIDTFFTLPERSSRPDPGPISVISQSGSVLTGVFEMAENEGTGIASCVGLGNKADLNENDFIDYFRTDPFTACITLYLESFSDGERFIELVRSVSPCKPVVALRAGRSERGRVAALSHTGALATTSDALVDGIFRQYGIVRAYDITELLDYAKALAYLDHISGDRIVVISSAGGFGIIAVDYIESAKNGTGMRLARLRDETIERIRDASVYFASVENPIDLTGAVTDSMYDSVLSILQDESGIDAVLILLQLQTPGTSERLVDIVEKWSKKGNKPIVVCSIGGKISHELIKKLNRKGVPSYNTLRRAIWALRALYERGLYLRRIGALDIDS